MAMEFRSDRLKVFLSVVKEGGFSRAARRLRQTQSSVSQAIAALEAEAGERLFIRSRRTVQLTQAGKVLCAHAGRALDELERAKESLWALRQVTVGTLALGTSDTLATYLLPPVFAAFRERFPGVELRLDNRPSPAIAAKVAAHELDLGLVSLPLPQSEPLEAGVQDLKQIGLVAQRDVVIAPAAHSLASRRRLTPALLAAEPLVLLDRTTATRAYLDAHFRAAGCQPRVVMEMSSVELLKKLVELGFGVSVVPEIAVHREVGDGSLVALALSGLSRPRQVGFVLRATGAPSRAAQAFIGVARELLRKSDEA
jgi:DNA-binding transcriptional LysR family regulator